MCISALRRPTLGLLLAISSAVAGVSGCPDLIQNALMIDESDIRRVGEKAS